MSNQVKNFKEVKIGDICAIKSECLLKGYNALYMTVSDITIDGEPLIEAVNFDRNGVLQSNTFLFDTLIVFRKEDK